MKCLAVRVQAGEGFKSLMGSSTSRCLARVGHEAFQVSALKFKFDVGGERIPVEMVK